MALAKESNEQFATISTSTIALSETALKHTFHLLGTDPPYLHFIPLLVLLVVKIVDRSKFL